MNWANSGDTDDISDWMPEIDLQVLKEDYDSCTDTMVVMVQLDRAIVQPFAFKIISSLGRDSFNDARPFSDTNICFDKKDQWSSCDVFRCLTFGEGKIRFSVQQIRGRFMGTEVVLGNDGLMTIKTWLRGRSASRWVGYLQGKKPLTLQYCGTLKSILANPGTEHASPV